MEIVLNEESKRKTPMAVAFHNNERFLGDEALNIGIRFPENCYVYFLDLIGKEFSHPSVKNFQEKFPYYKMERDPIRGTVLFRCPLF